MSLCVIGVDPGLDGALAMINHKGLEGLADMPTVARGAGGAFVKRQVNCAALAQQLREWTAGLDRVEVLVAIEAVTSLGGQGVASTFSFGLTAGMIEGVVAALGLPHELVRPQEWKKAMKLGPSKDQARALASRYYPEAELHLVKHHNRAESILIAKYVFQQRA